MCRQVRDAGAAVGGAQPDHDGGAHREHRHLPGAGHLLPHRHRGRALVDHRLLRTRPLHLPDIGRY